VITQAEPDFDHEDGAKALQDSGRGDRFGHYFNYLLRQICNDRRLQGEYGFLPGSYQGGGKQINRPGPVKSAARMLYGQSRSCDTNIDGSFWLVGRLPSRSEISRDAVTTNQEDILDGILRYRDTSGRPYGQRPLGRR
jgi:hypothetical protein